MRIAYAILFIFALALSVLHGAVRSLSVDENGRVLSPTNLSVGGTFSIITAGGAGKVLTSDGAGTGSWVLPATNSFATTNYAQLMTNFWSRNLKSQDFPNLRRAIATNAPIMVPGLGDSLINGTQLYQPFFLNLLTNYGYAGAIGQGGQGYWNPTVTTNATVQNGSVDNFKTWFSQYYGLPAGGCVTGTNVYNPAGVMANFGMVQYQETNGAGTFIIETNFNNTGWATCIASVNADNGGASTVRYAGFTNSYSCLLQIRARGLSRSNNIISLGLMNLGTNGGVIYNEMSLPGYSLVDFNRVPTNHTWPAFMQWNPTCIAMEWLDNAAQLATNCPQFLTNFHRYLPKCDLLWILANPIEPGLGEPDNIQQSDIIYTNAAAWGDHVYDGHGLFRDWNTGLTNGFLLPLLDPHPTQSPGDKFEADAMFGWMNLFPPIRNYPGRRYLIAGDNIDTDGGNVTVHGTGSATTGLLKMWQGTDPTKSNVTWQASGDGDVVMMDSGGGGLRMWDHRDDAPYVRFTPGNAANTYIYTLGAPPSTPLVPPVAGVVTGPVNEIHGSNVTVYATLSAGTNSTAMNQAGAHTNWGVGAVRAGGSVTFARAGGLLITNQISTGNGAATLTTLFTNNLPLNTITNGGDALLIRASGQYGATANADKTIALWLGNSMVYSNRQAINGGTWVLDAEIIRGTTTTNYDCNVMLITSTSGTTGGWATNMSAFVTNSLTPMGVWLTGNGTGASDVVGKTWRGRWEPSF